MFKKQHTADIPNSINLDKNIQAFKDRNETAKIKLSMRTLENNNDISK